MKVHNNNQVVCQCMTGSLDPLEDRVLLAEVIRALVDDPHSVRVQESEIGDETHFVVVVSPRDRGKVIGKRGVTVGALRTLFGRIAAVEGRKIFIRVAEPSRNAA